MKKASQNDFLKGSFIVFDTNILVDAIKFPVEFGDFFTEIEGYDCSAVLDATVKFEFLRGARKQNELDLMAKFLEQIFGKNTSVLTIDSKLLNIALKLAWCCSSLDNKVLSFPDVLIGAQILKYNQKAGNLLLATQNHKDFPPALFERKYTKIIELPNGSIKTICIYDAANDCNSLLDKAPVSK